VNIYSFGTEAGKDIRAYDSRNLRMSRVLDGATGEIHVGCMHLAADGVVGLHQATVPQLFMVVSGEGIVKGKEDREYAIKAGFAAYWEAGEWHETKTRTGLTAIVIEGEALNVCMKEEAWLVN
jgi:quercetin dioxygenase-like cupin family protein